MTLPRRRLLLSSAALALSVTLGVSACGSPDKAAGSKSSTTVSDTDLQASLDAGGSLKVWAWDNTLKQVATEFEKKYPKVKIDLVNVGTGNDQYTALQNAITAKSGVPDVAQIEYYALPQFALAKSLTDLSPYGAAGLDGTFSPGPWTAVHQGKSVYGLPLDSGPVALFYNKEVFDKHGIAAPTTWEEYTAAAEKLHKADPKAYITSDAGDAGFTNSLIWQAGGKPYTVDGTNVGVNFADPGTQKFTGMWQNLLDRKLLSPLAVWSDEWYKGLANGSIATLIIGAWMPANLESGVKSGSGKWRVAPMPQWEAGGKASSENGGSSLAVPTAAANKNLAYAFLKYAAIEEGVKLRVDAGAFPATTKELNAPEFLEKPFPYFGGQKANEVLSAAAAQVVPGWSFLPFQVYANSVFKDTVGKAYVSGTTLQAGLNAWQSTSLAYGKEQGFTTK